MRRGAVSPVAAAAVFVGLLAAACGDTRVASPPEAVQLAPLPAPPLDAMEAEVADRLRAARERTEAVWERDGASPEERAAAVGELGRQFQAYGLWAAAETCYRNATSLLADSVDWGYHLAVALEMQGKASEAVDLLDSLAPSTATASPAVAVAVALRRARLTLEQGRVEAAADQYRRILADSDEAAAHLGLGRALLSLGEAAAALPHFERALELQPAASAVHFQLARAYRQLGDPDLAARHAERAGPIEPSFPDPLVRGVGELADGLGVDLRRGDAALLSGDAEAAVAAYRLAVERSPDSASARHSLAASLAEAGRLEDSVAEFRRALEIEPRNPILLSGLATILFELGRREESLAEIERAVEIDPGSVDLQLRLASTYEATGDWAAALAGYDRVLEMDPARHDAALGRGLALARLGRGGEAVAALESVVAADPGRLDARFGLANLLAAEDRYLDAVPHYRAILERDAANLDVRLLEASALVLGGSYGEARDRLEEAMAVLPEESEVAHSLALLLASCPTSEVCEPERALGMAQGALDAEASLERAETVAIALAATGRWGEAVPWQEDLVAQAETLGAEGLLPRLRANLERYRAGRRALPPWQGGS